MLEIVVNHEGEKPVLEIIAGEDDVIVTREITEAEADKLVANGATEV